MATWTQQDIDTLKAAVASGVLTVTYSGGSGGVSRSITYQSLEAMRALLDDMLAEVEGESGARTRIRQVLTNKGL